MHHLSHRSMPSLKAMALAVLAMLSVGMAQRPAEAAGEYTIQEVVDAGHGFFGKASRDFARAVETVFEKQGQPTAYIVGEELAGSFRRDKTENCAIILSVPGAQGACESDELRTSFS